LLLLLLIFFLPDEIFPDWVCMKISFGIEFESLKRISLRIELPKFKRNFHRYFLSIVFMFSVEGNLQIPFNQLHINLASNLIFQFLPTFEIFRAFSRYFPFSDYFSGIQITERNKIPSLTVGIARTINSDFAGFHPTLTSTFSAWQIKRHSTFIFSFFLLLFLYLI